MSVLFCSTSEQACTLCLENSSYNVVDILYLFIFRLQETMNSLRQELTDTRLRTELAKVSGEKVWYFGF